MKMEKALYGGVAAVVVAVVGAGSVVTLGAQPAPSAAVAIDGDDIGGVVTGPSGPEAGVWVIAETTDFRPGSPGSSSPTTRGATSCPTCRRRATRCGCAATA